MKRKTYIIFILFALVAISCDKADVERLFTEPVDDVSFSADIKEHVLTRANWNMLKINVIAPGYGIGAANQEVEYDAVNGVLVPVEADKTIKWSAQNMFFTAWHASSGVDMEAGTIDFSDADLEDFVGSSATALFNDPLPAVHFEFKHLVSKYSIVLKNLALSSPEPLNNASIVFPAIKKLGVVDVVLGKIPTVSPGYSGDELRHNFTSDPSDGAILTCYMPPFTGDQLLMYGSFTVDVDGTTYVGTLQNLRLPSVEAGHHVSFEMHINDDHTAALQAVTLAKWDTYPKIVYNRPYPGIWGFEDLQALSEIINAGGGTASNGMTMDDFLDEEDNQIRVYANIDIQEDDVILPIGTEANPFGYEFDGNGYTISGLSLKNTVDNNQGLFGVIHGAIIKNLVMEGGFVEGMDHVGILVGRDKGGSIIQHCSVKNGEVLGRNNAGGLIGSVAPGTHVYNCAATVNSVSGATAVGGFAGKNAGTIGNSYSRIQRHISCETENVGGFLGENSGIIRNCYCVASFVNPALNCGALLGANSGGTVSLCYWNTECIDNNNCSKVIGNNMDADIYGVELLPGGTGKTFNKSTGRIVRKDNTYEILYDNLNDYINSNPVVSAGYLKWAAVGTSKFPVFSYSD